MNEVNKQIAFVVISCDKYSDLWNGFELSLEKFWVNCPFDQYLITNNDTLNSEKIKTINIGEDETWSIGLKKALITLKERYKYIIITLEDLYLIDYVDTENLNKVITKAINDQAKYVRLHRNKHKKSKSKKLYSELKSCELYRFNCTYAFWNIEFLYLLLKDNESAWEFEYNSPIRAKLGKKVYMVNKPIFKYSNTVIKGKWVPSEVKIINALFPEFRITREVMSDRQSRQIKRNDKILKFVTNYLPKKLVSTIVNNKRRYLK